MDCPFRLRIQGMTIGFFGDPRRPIVEAIGIPSSMCVAWISPLERESRIAAQLAPFETVDWIPYFLNNPFSCAITMGELSVRAIIPNLSWLVSGLSLARVLPAQPLGNPATSVVKEMPAVALRNWRRGEAAVIRESFMLFDSERRAWIFGEIAEPT